MFESFGRSWQLMKQSYSVLRQDKELMAFPILSGVFGLIAAISFFLPLIFFDLTDSILFYPVVFIFYFVTYFITIFFNAALIGAASIRLKGGDPTLSDGLKAASSNLSGIIGWALIAATVGMILRSLQGRSRNNLLGQLVIGLVGGAWSMITFFVVPVLVLERVGPLDAIKRSTSIVKERIGELAIGQLGLGGATFLIVIGGIIASIAITLGLSAVLGGAGLIIGIALSALLIMGIVIFTSTLSSIFVVALYHYAITGQETANWRIGEMVGQLGQQKKAF